MKLISLYKDSQGIANFSDEEDSVYNKTYGVHIDIAADKYRTLKYLI